MTHAESDTRGGGRRAVPFRTSLLVNLCAGVLLLGAVLFVTSYVANHRAVERLSVSLTERVMALTDARLQGFFEPVLAAIEIASDRVDPGDFDDFPLERLDRYFLPIVEALPQLSSVVFAHEDGSEYLLLEQGDLWKSRLSRPELWGEKVLWREWSDDSDEKLVREEQVDYDARSRLWHAGALARLEELGPEVDLRDRVHWTEPYPFFTAEEQGVTASLAFRTDTGRIAVLGFDVLLADISRFTTDQRVGERGKVFILRGAPDDPAGAKVIGLPSDVRFEDDDEMLESVAMPPLELGGPVADFIAQGEFAEGETHPFTSGGERWWGDVQESHLETSEEIWVGSVVPESELLAGLPDTNLIVALATVAIVLLAVLRSIRLSRIYASPLSGLARKSERMQRLDFQPGEPVESDITEIRQLGGTLEAMRQALHNFSSVREDTRVARSIRGMVVPDAPVVPGDFELALWHEPSDDVDGELVDAVVAGNGRAAGSPGGQRLVLLLADAEGTGIRPSVDGAQLRGAFRAGVRSGMGLSDLARALDAFVRGDLPARGPVRAWLATLDPEQRTLEIVERGFETALHRVAADGACRRLESAGAALGSGEEAEDGALPRSIELEPGDVVLLASDGVVEALDERRHRLGIDGLEELLRRAGDLGAEALVQAVRGLVEEHGVGRCRDRTVLVLRATPAEPA